MRWSILLVALAVEVANAFPWVASLPGVDTSFLKKSSHLAKRQQPGSAAACPNNSNHTAGIPISSKYPYCGASGGVPGKQYCPDNLVPAKGDIAHYYSPPGPNDIRGPCPATNTAANHNFISHDGITTFTELVDMQQNVFGMGYDTAVVLATLGVVLDGDPTTERLSIGCDATTRTAALPGIGPELGYDAHDKFEGDTSLTRNDYWLADGDNFSYNDTLFQMMADSVKGNFGRDEIARYRAERYNQSRADNPHFYLGPKSLLLFGASSFVYELFPSLGNAGTPDLATMTSFFVHERIPDNWYSRATPYSVVDTSLEIFYQYEKYPVQFGGNAGKGNFVGIGQDGGSLFNDGMFNGTAMDIVCLIYEIATDFQPSSTQAGGIVSNLLWATGKLNPIYQANGFPCPLNFNNA